MEILTPSELEQLLEILGLGTASFEAIEAQFRGAFREEQHAKIVTAIQFLRRDAGMIVGTPSPIEAVVAAFLLDLIRRGGGTAGSDAAGAKAAMFDLLLHMELLLREDARRAESSKYRSTTKESAQTSKKACRDVVDSEGMRMRAATKLFCFQCLAGKTDAAQTPFAVVAMDQSAVDSGLDAWQRSGGEMKEILSDLSHTADSENEKLSTGALSKIAALGYAPATGAAQSVYPSLVRPPLPCVATTISDMRMLLNLPSLGQQLIFDAQWHSADWRTAKALISEAAEKKLSPQQQTDAVQCLSSATVSRLGITAPLMCSVTSHNPEVAAAVLNRLKDAAPIMEAILSSQACPSDAIETVMLHSVKSLKQIHVYKYIAGSLQRIQAAESGLQKELIVNLASTMHQLITKFAKDNKELYINDAQKGELGALFEEHNSIPEVASRWNDLK